MKAAVLRSQWRAFWQRRSAQERRALRLLVWVLAAALSAQAMWSLEQGRRAAARQLAVLAGQAERMDALLHAWRNMTHASDTKDAPRPALVRQEVERRLPELGGGVTAHWAASGELQLKGRTDFAAWLAWIAAMQEENHFVVTRCRVSAAAAGVEIDASLAPGAAQP
jgi:type II secretory pathway component PulM